MPSPYRVFMEARSKEASLASMLPNLVEMGTHAAHHLPHLMAAAAMGHVGANAANKARGTGVWQRAAGRVFGGAVGPRGLAEDGLRDGLQGRILHPAHREIRKLVFGPETFAQEYSLGHQIARKAMHESGGDQAKAHTMIKKVLGVTEETGVLHGYAPGEHLQHAARDLHLNVAPGRFTIKHEPDKLLYRINDRGAKAMTYGVTAGGALAAGVPDVAIHASVNKIKDMAASTSFAPVRKAMRGLTNRAISAGVDAGKMTGIKRVAMDMIGSPGLAELRDAGAVVGRHARAAGTDAYNVVSQIAQDPGAAIHAVQHHAAAIQHHATAFNLS